MTTSQPDAFIKDKYGNTALHLAVKYLDVDLCKSLLPMLQERNDAGHTPLHVAAIRGAVRVVDYFMGVDSRLAFIKDNGGNTPLHLAALNDNAQSAKLLVVAKDEKNNDGLTALDLAVKNKFSNVIGIFAEPMDEIESRIAEIQNQLNEVVKLIGKKK